VNFVIILNRKKILNQNQNRIILVTVFVCWYFFFFCNIYSGLEYISCVDLTIILIVRNFI